MPQEEIGNLNSLLSNREIEFVNENSRPWGIYLWMLHNI